MFEELEVITLLLGLGVMAFVVRQFPTLQAVANWPFLFSAFALLIASMLCSVVEELVWEDGINFIQHLLSALSAVVLAVWCGLTFLKRKAES